ncbi:uncharacterized protein LOC126368594 [Pectinophora gossypiella]|uniref:uncharacterized protein LOC126368594 n=1 Tax=Pectinophora gossypiella TaxID=13191 RepID=UPI00214EFCAC|nr:uncharacterized protein LOC126368594 [Pectinophora gossypiella]
MSAPHAPRALCASAILCVLLARSTATIRAAASTPDDTPQPANLKNDNLPTKTLELFDGVTVKIPHDANSTEKLISFEIDTKKDIETGRGKQKKLMQRILPMFIMPFLIQSTIVPFFLSMLKFMLFKSMMVGKLALALILFNAFRNHNSVKGRDAQMADVHYGYHDNTMEPYSAYFN